MNSLSEVAGRWPQQRTRHLTNLLSGQRLLVAAFVVLCVLSVVPFLAVPYPPIVDFANHAARLNLACNGADHAVAAMYRYQLGIIPDLTVDVANLPACGLADSGTVLKLVTAASLALIYVSGWLIQRRLFGAPNAFLLLLPALAFNLVTTMGYINFLSGIAVLCLMAGLAIGRQDRFKTLLLLCNVGGTIVFFCHIFALAIALLLFFGLMLRKAGLSMRGVFVAGLRTGALFAVPLLLIPLVAHGGHTLSIGYENKLRSLVALGMAQHTNVAGTVLVLFPVLYLLLRTRIVEFHPLFRISLALLGLYVLLLPSQIGDAVDVDSRSLVALAYFGLATLTPVAHRRPLSIAIGALAAGSVAFQLWAAAVIWEPFSRQVTEFRAADSVLPTHATVLSVGEQDGPAMVALPMAYAHLASYATIDRRIFNPLEFTGVGMQPLSARPAFARLDTPAAQPFSPGAAAKLAIASPETQAIARKAGAEFALRWPERFDYVIYYHFGHRSNFAPAVLTEVRQGTYFSILKVRRAAVARQSGSTAADKGGCLPTVYQTCPTSPVEAAGGTKL